MQPTDRGGGNASRPRAKRTIERDERDRLRSLPPDELTDWDLAYLEAFDLVRSFPRDYASILDGIGDAIRATNCATLRERSRANTPRHT